MSFRPINGKLRPPVDVLLDPTLLVADTSLNRLAGSKVLDAQTQATLDHSPTTPPFGDLYVPASFREIVEQQEQLDVQKTKAWNFYCGQADGAYREDILNLLDQNDIKTFEDEEMSISNLYWESTLGHSSRMKV